MNKLKLFIENFLVYGLGGIANKVIPLIMVPIVTRLMPGTEYYGISDLSNTLVQLCSAVAVMGMYDAMYRMFFEKDDISFKQDVCSTAIVFTAISSVCIFAIMLIFKEPVANLFFKSAEYISMVYLSALATLVGATNQIIAAPTRMQNKRKIFLTINVSTAILSYSIAIPLILRGHYLIALPLSAFLSNLIVEVVYLILNRSWFVPKKFNSALLKQLLMIAIPLLPNFLIYWVFNSSNQLMITNILGVAEAGIYSVGAKLGHVSQLIYTAFAGGWQFFAFSVMKEKDQVESNSKIFEYLGVISFVATAFMCAWSYPIYKVLFAEQYHAGYIVAPYLFFAPLLQMLFQVAANQFLVVKKTWPNLFILSAGAILSVVLNLFLIPRIGIEGAGIATLIGYTASDIICVLVLKKMKLMVISGRFVLCAAAVVFYLVVWRAFFATSALISTGIALGVVLIYLFLYRADLMKLVKMVTKRG